MSEHAVNLQEKVKAFRPGPKPVDAPEEDEFLCWGCVRGNRQSFGVEYRRLSGTWPSLEYSWLLMPVWCPSSTAFANGLTIPSGSFIVHYSDGHRVAVAGQNLRMPYLKLLAHQVTYIAEVDQATAELADDEAVVITRIHVVEPGK
jgi:hypothetical protein